MKKLFALVLAFALLLAAIPSAALAATETEQPLDKHQQAVRDARRSYTYALRSAGRDTFRGYCGLMTSHQLRSVGINSWTAVYNGKDQYDAYCDKTVTSGGYYIKAYSAQSDMSLRDTLNMISQNGTRDVYNIMLGFQRTKSDAGSKYGHSCLINAILDGTVYMVECSATRLAPEGEVIVASIDEVADYYEGYARFEGAIWFGTGSYADSCDSVTTDLLLQARFDTTLRSLPSPVGQNGCEIMRSVRAGERLHASHLLTDALGQRYYRITDGELSGYIAAGACGVIGTGTESLQLQSISAPGGVLSGAVCSDGGRISSLKATVADETGAVVAYKTVSCDDYRADLRLLNIADLAAGGYTLRLEVTAACAGDGALMPRLYDSKTVLETRFAVDGAQMPAERVAEPVFYDGWTRCDGKWYYYENGAPFSGWLDYCGALYYLDETGAAVTGWYDTEGVRLRFSETGALCTGWVRTEKGLTWREDSGETASGVRRIGGALYGFDYYGILITEGQVTVGGTVYNAAADGQLTRVEKTA